MSTGEILRPHASASSANGSGLMTRVVAALAIASILGGLAAWSDGRITAATLAEQRQAFVEHKATEQQRLNELSIEMRALRDEMRVELRELRQAVERKR